MVRPLLVSLRCCNYSVSDSSNVRLQRRSIDRHLRSRTSTSTAVQKVLMLLVDLGIVYTIFMVRVMLSPLLYGQS